MKRFFLKNAIVAVSIPTVLLTGTSFSAAPAQTQPRQLSFAERVAYQYAIEEVYWRHRIWPKENPVQKPSLDEVMSAAQIQKKVEDYLRNSQLLADRWQRPMTPEQLQAEMERMASQTKQPEVLQELFAALGNDPVCIAECLARPVLSERFVKQFYAHDERIHGELKRRAESELRACQSVEQMKQTSGTYSEMKWIKSNDESSDVPGVVATPLRGVGRDVPQARGYSGGHDEPNAIRMTASEWEGAVGKLAAQFDATTNGRVRPQLARRGEGAPRANENDTPKDLERIRVGTLSPLQEDDAHYYATAVVEKEKGRLKVAIITWPKEPFESWAAKAQIELPGTAVDLSADYTLPAIASSFIANPATDCTNDSWIPTANSPTARNGHTAVWTGSEMIVWGGFGGGNIGERYNPSTDRWGATTSVSAPASRQLHSAVWTGSEMIVWGGLGHDDKVVNTGGRYNPTTDSWVATTMTNAPEARDSHTAVWTGNEMIIWAGERNGLNQVVNSGGRYSPASDSWTAISASNAPSARYRHTAVWSGNEMIVWGGYDGNPQGSGGRYDPSTNTWVITTSANAPSARFGHTAVWTDGEMIVWGGYNTIVYLNNGGRYSPSTNSWIATNVNAPAARSDHTAVWTGNEMIIWGGGNSNGFVALGGRYKPSTNNWLPVSTINAPPRRFGHRAVWTGNEMIIWGGDYDDYVKTGGRYNPTTDSWVSTNASPDPRNGHTAVWTGNEMIVWGGDNGNISDFGVTNTGGRYSPSLDNWVATSTLNAPEVRSAYTTVWTGSEMIVWGGYNYNGGLHDLNTGGRYNPSMDNWIATQTNIAPAARAGHTAVWTGSEMIIWGGYNGTELNTGGRFNPSTDSWTATASVNGPQRRQVHTAIWTGSEMIVWGGAFYDGSVHYENSGAKYNPITDSWLASAIANAPNGRGSHAAVWTGTEMIVWGGGDGSAYFNTGGKYNPGTNSWFATNVLNAPVSRESHTAVWTGSEMIIWGGYNGTFLNTGGRYGPSTDVWTSTGTANAPSARSYHTSVWTGSEMIVWGGGDATSYFDTGGRYCAQSAAPAVQSAVSRKVHGLSGTFGVDLPLTGTPGIECRTGGATNDYSVVVTFASAVTVNGSPQAQVISGTGTVGSGGVSNGGMVTISGNSVTVPLTNVGNSQTINVRLNGVTGSSGSGNVTIPMSLLVGDTNANGAVNSGDVAQTKARLGQTIDATNFRSDVNANGAINAGDVSQIKSLLGTGLP